MEKTVTKYIATITVGDEYHKAGEEHVIFEHTLKDVQEQGLRLEVWKDNTRIYYHMYPCTLRKVVYAFEEKEITTLKGGDRSNPCLYNHGGIGVDYHDLGDKNDWMDRWP